MSFWKSDWRKSVRREQGYDMSNIISAMDQLKIAEAETKMALFQKMKMEMEYKKAQHSYHQQLAAQKYNDELKATHPSYFGGNTIATVPPGGGVTISGTATIQPYQGVTINRGSIIEREHPPQENPADILEYYRAITEENV